MVMILAALNLACRVAAMFAAISAARFRFAVWRHGVVLVVWTERDGDTIRIISARFATKREIELLHRYMENTP